MSTPPDPPSTRPAEPQGTAVTRRDGERPTQTSFAWKVVKGIGQVVLGFVVLGITGLVLGVGLVIVTCSK